MDAYLSGDQEAFQELFRRFAPALTRLFQRAIRKNSDVDDLLQETFLNFHRARYDFRRGSPLRPYLMTIGLNLRHEHLRRHYRRREQHLDRDLQGVDERLPSNGMESHQTSLKVRKALKSLPEKQRLAIELHWYQGLPFPEVARILGGSLSAAKVWAHRGYVKLRKVLEDEDV